MKCKKCGSVLDGNDSFCRMCGSKIKRLDKGLILIIIFGVLAFASIGGLIYFSLTTTSTNKVRNIDNSYSAITGDWVDSSLNNMFRITNTKSYVWYQNYSMDKNSYITGNLKVLSGDDALLKLNIDLDTVKSLINVEDIVADDVYYLQLFTSNKNIRYSYYKFLVAIRDEDLIIYNYNDKEFYYCSKR